MTAVAVTFMSCSLTLPSADDVYAKIMSGESLDDEDYESMIEYLDEFCDAGEDSPNTYEAGQEIGDEYPYFITFAIALDSAPESIKDSDDYKEVTERFAKLVRSRS